MDYIKYKNFKDSILTAVSMGDDADTVGAITGSIAGLIYGLDNIPNNWMENLKKKDYLIELADSYETFLNKKDEYIKNMIVKLLITLN